MGRAYWRALTQRRGPLDISAGIPELRTRLRASELDGATLDSYRAACGAKAAVPVGYPQMQVTPVHVEMLVADEFPIRAMGLIHPRFSITQHRPLEVGEQVEYESWLSGLREVHNGVEFDIETRATVSDKLVWASTAATFHRMANERRGAADEELELPRSRPFVVPSDAGRRYASVSGDYNPVHLHPLTSKLFGFSKPIAHGWWLVARCLAELGLDAPSEPTTFDFEFRRPVALGATYQLAAASDGARFAVVDDRGKRRLVGSVRGAA
jgi:acyl dehydratase